MTDTPDQDRTTVAQSAVPAGVAHPVEALHEAVQEDEAALAATAIPDPGPVPEAQAHVGPTDSDAVATSQAAAMATEFMPYKELFQLMGAIVFVLIVLAVGWNAMHASGIWPE
ncbi:hypothetical protein [Komagataeibacter swingsii]|uniref:Uncharacterized protein n=1 Tax=Komagataeibacter swingsii TaxID=215220 RepID=A0A2V4SDX8_9PROT|nr:hypothetical protein [Komagataeibacter swingsii]PYD70138.1 hypothetical protein CFR76_06100 [Komagataeibacter swingsii]GBQ65256.1 hypothetical protein AA16373_3037 [Komagataeibacter swingsii DSM 16373]